MEPWRIALVDDDVLVRRSLERLLKLFGFDVRAYPSATEFLEENRSCLFSCLVLDVCMPGMSGPELYKRLREDGNELPTIFMSAHEDVLQRAAESFPEVDERLQKPFDEDQLLVAIEKVMAGRHPRVDGSGSGPG